MGLRYGLIGCGRISPNHIAAALENELEIVAICDIVKAVSYTHLRRRRCSTLRTDPR